MRLADHGVTADTAQRFRDLAGGLPGFPHRLERPDALFGPGHAFLP
jgi:hypothetical protein